MCGLFGHSFSPSTWEQFGAENYVAFCTLAGAAMDERGRDSWGLVSYDSENWTPSMQKGLGNIAKDVPTRFRKGSPHLSAHCRKATTGAVTVENSHPLIVPTGRGVIGAHNGIVSNWTELKTKWSVESPVDSAAIFHAVSHGHPLTDIKAMGAVVFSLADDPNKIFLSRFNSGVLSVMGIGDSPDDSAGVVWASTEMAIKAALAAAGVQKFFTYKIEEGERYWIENGKLYKAADDPFNIASSWRSSGYCAPTGYGRDCGYQGNHPGMSKKSHRGSAVGQDDIDFPTSPAITSSTATLHPRIQNDIANVTPLMIEYWGRTSDMCDWCKQQKWEMYLINERVFLCGADWNEWTGNEVAEGHNSYNTVLYKNTLTRYEIYEKKAKH